MEAEMAEYMDTFKMQARPHTLLGLGLRWLSTWTPSKVQARPHTLRV